MLSKNTVKAHTVIEWIGIGLTVITIAIAVIALRYQLSPKNVKGGDTIPYVFSSSTASVKSGVMDPIKGYIKYGWAQTKGNSKIQYALSYKKTTEKNFHMLASSYKFEKNKKYYGDYTLLYTNGRTNYNVNVYKQNEKNTASTIKIDWFITDKK